MIETLNYDSLTKITANSYIIYDDNTSILIDCGIDDEKEIKRIFNTYTTLNTILLTHGHFDHIRGINKILDKKMTIYLSKKDFELLNNPSLNGSEDFMENVSVDIKPIEVIDNQILEFNNLKFKVIETPFHTMGSVCYLYLNEEMLFTGDTLFRGSIGRYDFETSNPKLIKSSLSKLKKLLDTYDDLKVYPGHGNITTLKNEVMLNPFFRNA